MKYFWGEWLKTLEVKDVYILSTSDYLLPTQQLYIYKCCLSVLIYLSNGLPYFIAQLGGPKSVTDAYMDTLIETWTWYSSWLAPHSSIVQAYVCDHGIKVWERQGEWEIIPTYRISPARDWRQLKILSVMDQMIRYFIVHLDCLELCHAQVFEQITDTTHRLYYTMGRPSKDPNTVIPKKPQSLVWQHYGDNQDGVHAHCILCKEKNKNVSFKINDFSTKPGQWTLQ
jgi:hypothetical protein